MIEIVELRQYTLRPGHRDTLVELFDREFVESQEELGATVLGTFRDLYRPDRFVWLRGFADMATRLRALTDFYGGPVWKAHRDAANATMIDSDDVLLLRPTVPITLPETPRPGHGATPPDSPAMVLTLHHLPSPVDGHFVARFDAEVRPTLGAPPLLTLQSEYADNDFPALPVRTGENIFAYLTRARSLADGAAALPGRVERLRLAPTARSWLR